jgi:hypothetical protein
MTSDAPVRNRPVPTVRPRGLVWATIRTDRGPLWLGLLLSVLQAGRLLAGWFANRQSAVHDQLACVTGSSVIDGCRSWPWLAEGRLADALADLTFYQVLPPLCALCGVLLIARELERRTAVLQWTQSCSPRRWLLTRLGVASVTAFAPITAAALLGHRLLARAYDLHLLNGGVANQIAYRISGPGAGAAAVLALALGALAAVAFGRTLPALGACLVPFGILTGFAVTDWSRLYPRRLGYWPLQLLETGAFLVLAVLVALVAVRVLRRRAAA